MKERGGAGRGGVHSASRNDFLEAKVVEGNEVNRLKRSYSVRHEGESSTNASFYDSISVYSRSTRASRMKKRMWVGCRIGEAVRSRFIDPRFEKLYK